MRTVCRQCPQFAGGASVTVSGRNICGCLLMYCYVINSTFVIVDASVDH